MKPAGIWVQANAKINLTLDVLEERRDGYHNIRSVMQSISLHDRLSLTRTECDISIEGSHREVPWDADNLACRAALELQKTVGTRQGVHIKLWKGIPVAAGLGGGSADAAAVLRGLNRLWDTKLDGDQMREIGKRIGADVPFCLTGGTALAEGMGDILTPLEPVPMLWLVLFKPFFGVSTGEVYRAHRRIKDEYRYNTEDVLSELKKGALDGIISGIGNTLQRTTTSLYPEVADIIHGLEEIGIPKVFMCGSGPTVCAVVSDKKEARQLKGKCSGFNGNIYIAHTVPRAGVFLER